MRHSCLFVSPRESRVETHRVPRSHIPSRGFMHTQSQFSCTRPRSARNRDSGCVNAGLAMAERGTRGVWTRDSLWVGAGLAEGAAAATELGYHVVGSGDGYVVDAAAAVGDSFDRA